MTAAWPAFAPFAIAPFVAVITELSPLCASACCPASDFDADACTCPSAAWPEPTAFVTAPAAWVASESICDCACGSVDLMLCAASLPLASNVWPILSPWPLTPETTPAPWLWTLPAVSPETLDATFALPSWAASFEPPPPPD